jgi:hypothetical protein
MNKQYQKKVNWQSALGAIAIAGSTFGIRLSPAQAAPKLIKSSFELAQVGIRSSNNAPVPLNLRPRTHIPLPTSSSSQDYYGYPGSRDREYRHDEYGYDHDQHHDHHRSDRQNNGTIIIINPATSSYSDYSNQSGYIRVIRK